MEERLLENEGVCYIACIIHSFVSLQNSVSIVTEIFKKKEIQFLFACIRILK
jgi:hypothetical protein